MKNITTLKLYNGGWRASDRDELMEEYGFTADEVKSVCDELEYLDSWKIPVFRTLLK